MSQAEGFPNARPAHILERGVVGHTEGSPREPGSELTLTRRLTSERMKIVSDHFVHTLQKRQQKLFKFITQMRWTPRGRARMAWAKVMKKPPHSPPTQSMTARPAAPPTLTGRFARRMIPDTDLHTYLLNPGLHIPRHVTPCFLAHWCLHDKMAVGHCTFSIAQTLDRVGHAYRKHSKMVLHMDRPMDRLPQPLGLPNDFDLLCDLLCTFLLYPTIFMPSNFIKNALKRLLSVILGTPSH